MEPLSVVATAISLATFLKDLIELGRQIRRNIDKVGRNKKRLHSLTDDIINGLVGLERFYQSRQNVLDGLEELSASLDSLRCEMSQLLENCLGPFEETAGGRMASAKAKIKAWTKGDDIEADIINLRDRVHACHLRFTTIATARIEHSLSVLKEEFFILSNEQKVRLAHMETMVTRLVINTQVDLGRVGRHTAGDSLAYNDDRDIPHQYLRMQVREIVDSLQNIATSGSFAAEEPKGIYLEPFQCSTHYLLPPPRDDPADQHRKVVAEALRILRRLMNDHEGLSIQDGALDMFHLSCSLWDLGVWEDAEIVCTWAANLYRTLVRGNVIPFLPYLAMTLLSLSAYRGNLNDTKGTEAASTEAVKVYRILHDTGAHPHVESFAVALGNHSQVLNFTDNFEESFAAAEESVAIFRRRISEESELVVDDVDDDLENLFTRLGEFHSESTLDMSVNDEDIPKPQVVEKSAGAARRVAIGNVIPLKWGLGRALDVLSGSLTNIGRDVDANNAAEESVNILRSISELQPDTFRVPLAQALYRWSHCLSKIGRHLEALPLMEEAVTLWRELSQRRPTTFSTFLISALRHVASLLRKTGRDGDAVAAGNEAIRAYRCLIGEYPTVVLYQSKVFDDVDSELWELGRDEEALELNTEIVAAYRKSVSDFPFLSPSFAKKLHRLAWYLHNANRLEDAVGAGKEAVDVYRTLATNEPDVYSSHLALSLATLVRSLYATNLCDEGIAAGNEVVQLYRVFGKGQRDLPPTFLMALNRLWSTVEKANRMEDSLIVGTEVVCIHRTRAEDHQTNYPGNFIGSLLDHATNLHQNGQHVDGVTANEEVVNLCRSFDCPESHYHFVVAENDLASGLWNLGRVDQATSVCQEAIAICRKLSSQPKFTKPLAYLLSLLADCYSTTGQFDEALAAAEESVSLSRDMSSEHSEDLTIDLTTLAGILLKVGKSKDATRTIEEAVGLCRTQPRSQDSSIALAYSLSYCSNCLANAQRDDEALAAAQEAVNLYQQSDPSYYSWRFGLYDFEVADALHNFAARLATAGRPSEALEYTREAASIYRTVVTTRPIHLPKFAMTLQSLSARLLEAGYQAQSTDAREEETLVRQRIMSMYPELAPALRLTTKSCGMHNAEEPSGLEARGKAIDDLALVRSELGYSRILECWWEPE